MTGRRARPAADEEPKGEAAARQIVLDSLSRSARTRHQLEETLARKNVDPEAARAVLDRFEELGLVDDSEYAEAFVASRHAYQGKGGRALTFELRRRGVAEEVVAEAVGALDSEVEFATACRIAQAKFDRMASLEPRVRARRLAGFLARKGYAGDIASRAVRQVLESAAASRAASSAGEWDDEEAGDGAVEAVFGD